MCNLYKSFVIFYSQLLIDCNRRICYSEASHCNAVFSRLSKLLNCKNRTCVSEKMLISFEYYALDGFTLFH